MKERAIFDQRSIDPLAGLADCRLLCWASGLMQEEATLWEKGGVRRTPWGI
jgi:hypothetical protein